MYVEIIVPSLHTFIFYMHYFLIEVEEEEQELMVKIGQIWEDLFTEAREVGLSLTDVKKSFSVVRYQTHGI